VTSGYSLTGLVISKNKSDIYLDTGLQKSRPGKLKNERTQGGEDGDEDRGWGVTGNGSYLSSCRVTGTVQATQDQSSGHRGAANWT
jgi:hypothetical protein